MHTHPLPSSVLRSGREDGFHRQHHLLPTDAERELPKINIMWRQWSRNHLMVWALP